MVVSTEVFTKFFAIQPFLVQCADKYYKKTVLDSPIAHFYSFTANSDCRQTWAVPDGCVDFEFHCSPERPEAFICGTVTTGKPFFVEPGVTYFGVRYHPGVFPHRLGLLGIDLTDRRVPLEELPGGRALIAAVTEAGSFEERIEAYMGSGIEQSIGWTKTSEMRLLSTVLKLIVEKCGDVRIQELERETGYTARNINYLFNRYMGVSPKSYCKFIRFQTLLGDIHRHWGKPFSGSISVAGYYDHSHMLRDFKAYTSCNLGQYTKAVDLVTYSNKIVDVS
ncbi:MAG: AraC family transcriptional regulator [Clostridiales Family XIII bacterium]|nr:AraC family transcriptional regulator [Clostridiales Family XIII bacterium]